MIIYAALTMEFTWVKLVLLYTKDGMEITEPAQAKMMHEDNVGIADIESNGGGSRNEERK